MHSVGQNNNVKMLSLTSKCGEYMREGLKRGVCMKDENMT